MSETTQDKPLKKIGTRGSKLATTQAGHVRDWITANGTPSELHIVTTAGDVNMAPVERIGVGVFTHALREALHERECDIAVHSFKDLPTRRMSVSTLSCQRVKITVRRLSHVTASRLSSCQRGPR